MSDTPRTDEKIFEAVMGSFPDGSLQVESVVDSDFARELERELNAAKSELTTLKKLIRQIYYDAESYADGAPDASDHDKLCNEISSILEPFVTPVTQTTNPPHP